MPCFTDEWLTDRVLFDYVAGGSCACCGFAHFLPNGTKDLITAISDIDTDAANNEVDNLDNSPWPKDLRDQVWGDRVKLRQAMKKDMIKYKEFWLEHGDAVTEWLQSQDLSRLWQVPRSEIMNVIREKYDIHSAFGVVLCASLEQVAHFEETKYPPDSKGATELAFENALGFDKRGGFVLKDGVSLLDRFPTLGGPVLLDRRRAMDDDDDDEEPKEQAKTKTQGGHASDRRIIRLLIARYWADLLVTKYTAYLSAEER